MLLEIEIENLALFRSARVRLRGGLNALTGETGAGKSLVLKALALLRGQKADKGVLRDGASECRVAALLRIPAALRDEIAGRIAPIEIEGDEILLARTIGEDGRGRCYVDQRLVPLATLRAVGSRLIDVLGQGESQRLAEPAWRARLVDAFGGLDREFAAYSSARDAALACRERRDVLTAESQQRRQRLDFLRFQRGELAQAAVQPGECDALASELDVLQSAAELRELCGGALDTLNESEDAIVARLGALERRIDALAAGARDLLGGAAAALARARSEIDDAVAGFRAALDRANVDERRLADVSERLDALRRLLDRYGPDEARLLARQGEVERELAALESEETDCGSADAALAEAIERLEAAGAALDRRRAACGRRLADAVQSALRALGMEHARFAVELAAGTGDDALARATAAGSSRVDFLLAANPGLAPRPIDEVASGGESARIALALRKTLSETLDVPVMVFDEVESGVGARLGAVVGATLAAIARGRQVIVVTHLEPVARAAEHHLRVRKKTVAGSTEARIDAVDGAEREHELALMMRGKPAPAAPKRARSAVDEESAA